MLPNTLCKCTIVFLYAVIFLSMHSSKAFADDLESDVMLSIFNNYISASYSLKNFTYKSEGYMQLNGMMHGVEGVMSMTPSDNIYCYLDFSLHNSDSIQYERVLYNAGQQSFYQHKALMSVSLKHIHTKVGYVFLLNDHNQLIPYLALGIHAREVSASKNRDQLLYNMSPNNNHIYYGLGLAYNLLIGGNIIVSPEVLIATTANNNGTYTRLNNNANNKNIAFSPRLGISYLVNESCSIYSSISYLRYQFEEVMLYSNLQAHFPRNGLIGQKSKNINAEFTLQFGVRYHF